MHAEMPLAPGTKVGSDYVIEACLGMGGFGVTYRALDNALQIPVALKEYFPKSLAYRDASNHVLPRDGDADSMRGNATSHIEVDLTTDIRGAPVGADNKADVFRWGLDRFVQEANLLARLNHRNIVRVFRVFRENGTAYMALELVDGPDLETARRLDPFTQEGLDRLVRPLLDALEIFDAQGIVHRDIKPANILLRSSDRSPVLLDFGSAHLSANRSDAAILTPGFAPVEQYAANVTGLGPWTDIYGLAATIYSLLTGAPPEEAPGRVLEDKLQPLAIRAELKDYRRQFLQAVDWGLAVSPRSRPQSVAEWRQKLLAATEGSLGSKIFISYRRSDTRHVAGRVFDRLVQEFGENEIFFDVDRIPYGVDFRTYITQTLKECAVVIALIGPQWASREWTRGRRGWMFWRSQKDDFVEVEISLALQSGVPILPVLVDGTSMPAADAVPRSIEKLVYLNASVLRSGRDFRVDAERIIAAIRPYLPATAQTSALQSEPASPSPLPSR